MFNNVLCNHLTFMMLWSDYPQNSFVPHAFHDIHKNLFPSESSPQFIPIFSSFNILTVAFSSVQWLSHVWHFVAPGTAACQASLSITNSWSLLKLTSIKSVMPTNHLILCCPLLLQPSIFPTIIGSFPMSQFFASGGQSIMALALIFTSLMHFADIIFILR